MNTQTWLDLLLGAGWLATFVPMVRGNIRKETVTRQSELIEALRLQNRQQARQIEELTERLEKLEKRDARLSRLVQQRSEDRNGRAGCP